MLQSYTLDQIKAAFWKQFEGAGELWFPQPETEEDGYNTTQGYWEEFLSELEKQEGS